MIQHVAIRQALSFLAFFVWLGTAVAADAPSAGAAGRPAGQVRGAVSYARRAPAVGAIVLLRPENAATPLFAATTGANGSFGFDAVPDGTYRAEVRREGYATQQKTGIVVRSPFRAVVEVMLAPGKTALEAGGPPEGAAALAGRVRVAGGSPIAEVRARIVRPDAADDPRSALTDATGSFGFQGLKAGRWRLELSGAGLLPLRTEVDLEGDVLLDAALARQPANYQPPPQDLIVPEEVIPPKK